jgi:hypothetical protein
MIKNELATRHVEPGSPVPGVPDRATRVASWIGWHLFEIAGVTVPAVFAVSVTPWAWLVSGVVGAGWTVHEVRVTQARRQGSVTGPGRPRGLHRDHGVSVPDSTSDVDDTRAGGVR